MYDIDYYLSGRVSALHSLGSSSIPRVEDHGIHCWWDLIRSKQQSSGSVCDAQCLLDFLVIVIQVVIPLLRNRNCVYIYIYIYNLLVIKTILNSKTYSYTYPWQWPRMVEYTRTINLNTSDNFYQLLFPVVTSRLPLSKVQPKMLVWPL